MSEFESGKVILRKLSAEPAAQKVTKQEREDIMRVIRSREKALRTMVTARAAELKSSFEAQISRVYDPRENPIWNEAVSAAEAAVAAAQATVNAECERLGIAKEFRPGVSMGWHGRGENALARRRAELRALANAQIDEAKKRALEQIDITMNAARERVIVSGLGAQAIEMLNELPALEQMVPTLSIDAAEHDLLKMNENRRRELLGGDYYRYN